MDYIICGKHTVSSAYKNKRTKKIYLTNINNSHLFKITDVEIKKPSFFKSIIPDTNVIHQGFAALVSPIKQVSLEKIIENKYCKIVALQGVEDQRNIGSIIRTCAAFEIDCLVIEKNNFNEKNMLMNKSHVGNIEYLNIITVSNIYNVIKKLTKYNFTSYCLDQNSDNLINNENFAPKSIFVFGSEEKGAKKYIKNFCDVKIKIKINEKVESLNVSNALAVTLSHL